MPFQEKNGLKYFTFSLFDDVGLSHGIFTRHGGVSPAPWDSLNTGGLSGDDRSNVIENRRRIFTNFSLPVESIFDVWQVHSNTVVCTDHPRALDTPHQKADAILTNRRGITLFMRFGDCVPILLLDPVNHVIGLVHAGWQGTMGLIAEIAVQQMVTQFGCKPQHIQAGIGPSIGPDHYQVQEDVITQFRTIFKNNDHFIFERDGRKFLDLWKANQFVLERAGVTKIEHSGLCTACDTKDWYSHRAEHGKTGRFGAIISLD